MSENAKEKIIWVLSGALILIALAGFFWLGKWQGAKKCGLANEGAGAKNSAKDSVPMTIEKKVSGETTGDTTTSQENFGQQEKTTDWKTFINSSQKYKFSYPASGQVVQAQTSGREEDVDPTDGACVTLKLANGYVTILGKTHTEDQAAMCLGTGLGTEWSNVGKINVEVFGKKYTVSGMGTSSVSAGYRQEFYVVNTTGGERVKFGIEINEKYAPEVTYEEAKSEVLAVLKTLKQI